MQQAEKFYFNLQNANFASEGSPLRNKVDVLSENQAEDLKILKSVYPQSKSISIPWLLVHGSEDKLIPISDSASLASNFEDKLSKIIGNYQHYLDLVNNYPLDADIMSKNYLSLFLELINSKDTFLNQRRFKKITSPLKRWFYLKIDFFK